VAFLCFLTWLQYTIVSSFIELALAQLAVTNSSLRLHMILHDAGRWSIRQMLTERCRYGARG